MRRELQDPSIDTSVPLWEYRQQQVRAREMMRLARKAGTLVTPNGACELCGERPERPLHGHHHNGYGPGHELDLQWLCNPCHQRAHPKRFW